MWNNRILSSIIEDGERFSFNWYIERVSGYMHQNIELTACRSIESFFNLDKYAYKLFFRLSNVSRNFPSLGRLYSYYTHGHFIFNEHGDPFVLTYYNFNATKAVKYIRKDLFDFLKKTNNLDCICFPGDTKGKIIVSGDMSEVSFKPKIPNTVEGREELVEKIKEKYRELYL